MKTILCFTLTFLTFLTLVFVPNTFAQDESPEYVVRVIYFIPNDRKPDPDINTKLDTLIKDAQQFFADQMEAHGFGRKTFRFKVDDAGNVVVHHVTGQFKDADYQNPDVSSKVLNEIAEQFDSSKNINFIVLGSETDYLSGDRGIIGLGHGESHNGWVIVPAFNFSDRFYVSVHELGHAFGLHHDYRVIDANIILTNEKVKEQMITTYYAAEWLNVNRYFNTTQGASNENTRVQMLTPNLAVPPGGIRLQFEVTDPDGLHQAQLFKPYGWSSVIYFQSLSSNSDFVEFVTYELIDGKNIVLRVIDVHGNFSEHRFPIDITDLLPPPDEISIPDELLAKGLRNRLGLAQNSVITQLDMLRIEDLFFKRQRPVFITDLTGLEYAKHMWGLKIHFHRISDISPLENLTNLEELEIKEIDPRQSLGGILNDISPLENLTNLRLLRLPNNLISDISPLKNLTNLEELEISHNQVSNISPLKNLTELKVLWLPNNQVSNISPLKNLTKLKFLSIHNNSPNKNEISDITPLKNLTELEELWLFRNKISDITPLKNLTELEVLLLFENKISDISPVKNLTKLKLLKLWTNEISDINPVKNLTELEELSVTGNKISDISPVKNLTKLKDLRFGKNKISDISPVKNLTELEVLRIHDNQISDITHLTGLTNLRHLFLVNNQITDVSPLTGLTSLEELYLIGNPIKNPTPLFVLLEKNPNIRIYLKNFKEWLPVTLSHFSAEHTNASVVLKWTTESELDNAGFYIYRSETKDGEFKVVNPTMIQGAGTTGERNEYTWTDTTAKPNTVYYYRIEDVSHAGVREQLATVRLRGLVSASGKLTNRWANLKRQK